MPGLGASVNLLGVPDVSGPHIPLTASVSDGIRFGEGALTASKRFLETDAFGIGIHQTDVELIRPGRIVNEVVNLQQTLTANTKYSWTIAERIYLTQALSIAFAAGIGDAIHIQPAMSVIQGVMVLQGLGVAATPLPSLKYTQALIQSLALNDTFHRFIGASASETINIAQAQSQQLRATPAISEAINIAQALSNHLILSVTASDAINLHDVDVLKLIYSGETLLDGIEIVAGYVSPDGQFTTWAINTRTAAVSEYTNYQFNSFCRMGNIYYGASSSGLYQLLGDDDDGADIIATLRSGFAQWAGSRFTMFKGIYLGVRGEGDWVLKLITGDDNTYIYSVSTRNQRTTKVHLGKGLRARYWQFELTSTGQDFDLDTIEFVPLVADRRV